MEKKLKDYLHLYLGCDFRYRFVDWKKDTWSIRTKLNYRDCDKMVNDLSIDKVEIFLRPLSSMTEEEKVIYEELQGRTTDFVHKVVIKVDIARSFKWLLDNYFDIFGLIEAGLAIDKTKINP